MSVNLVEIDYELTEIFDKNRYNGQVGNCHVSVGRYNKKHLIAKTNSYSIVHVQECLLFFFITFAAV